MVYHGQLSVEHELQKLALLTCKLQGWTRLTVHGVYYQIGKKEALRAASSVKVLVRIVSTRLVALSPTTLFMASSSGLPGRKRKRACLPAAVPGAAVSQAASADGVAEVERSLVCALQASEQPEVGSSHAA